MNFAGALYHDILYTLQFVSAGARTIAPFRPPTDR